MLSNSMVRLLLSGARVFTKVQAHSNLQEAGMVALSHLTAELRMTSWSTLTIRAADEVGPLAISFQPVAVNPIAESLTPVSTSAASGLGTGPSGTFVVYYLDAPHRMLQRGQTTFALAPRMDPVSLAQSIQRGLSQPATMASQVDALVVTPGTFPGGVTQAQSIHATISLSAVTNSTTTRESVIVAVSPRN
jgi:hypothetical protein